MINENFLETNRDYMECYFKGLRFKDWGMLRSSLDMRRKGTELAGRDPGMHAIGKANEVTLLSHHIGDGLGACAAVKESLKNIEAFAQADSAWKSSVGFSLLHDCLGHILNFAESYEEAEQYCELAKIYEPGSQTVEMNLAIIKEARAKGEKWWKVQFGTAQKFYSRATPSLDAGKHAAGMAVLQCIIARACAEKSGYEIEADDLFDILDDYIALSINLYRELFAKFQTQIQNRNQAVMRANGPEEQYIIFEGPLKHWLELMPDCPEKWKQQLGKYYETLMQSPFPIHPEIMAGIGAYFPDVRVAKKRCERCGYENSGLATVCIKCGNEMDALRQGKTPPASMPRGKAPAGCLAAIMIVLLGVAGYYWYSALITKAHGALSWVLAVICSLLFLNSIFAMIKNRDKK